MTQVTSMCIIMTADPVHRRALLTVRPACSQPVREVLKPHTPYSCLLCRSSCGWILHEQSTLLHAMHMLTKAKAQHTYALPERTLCLC
jgi:hypothetical protein